MTKRQGQFLAFIHSYWKLHRHAPSEAEFAAYFQLTPPSVHNMIVKLDQMGLITRQPGAPRTIRVAIPETEIPLLEDIAGPPW